MKYMRSAMALLLCCTFALSSPYGSYAANEDETEVKAQATDKTDVKSEGEAAPQVDLVKLESIGLLSNSESGSLGNGMYHSADRASLTGLYTNLQKHSDIIGLQKLTNRMLLTNADAGQIQNNIEVANGADLLTIRLETLLERGMNLQAFELVSKFDEDMYYHPRLSKAAVLAILFSGEKGLACLESKALYTQFQDDSFWKTLGAYCTLSLSDAPNADAQDIVAKSEYPIIKDVLSSPDYVYAYTPQSFEALSITERAILVTEKRISINGLDEATLLNLPATHIQPLLSVTDLTPQQRLLFTAQGLNAGVLPVGMLADQFLVIALKMKEENRAPSGMEELAPMLQKVKVGWQVNDQDIALTKSMAYAEQFNPAFIVPFISAYENQSNLSMFSLPQIKLILRAFMIADRPLPKGWFSHILQREVASKDDAFLKTKLIMATALLSTEKTMKEFHSAQYTINFSQDRDFQLFSYKNIIENIDNTPDQYVRVRYIYENGFDSAWNKSYTMPPYVVLSELADAARNSTIANVIALCNLASAQSEGKTIYPGLVSEMYKNLTAVGLSKQAKEIVAQAILEIE